MKKIILITTFLIFSSKLFAQTKAEKLVAETVESLRKAMIDGNRTDLESLTHTNLSYGHSNGKIETKAEYVENIASGTNNYETIELSNQTIQISGKNAVVRHIFKANYSDKGKPGIANIAVLQVYQKNGKNWLLLARQAVKI